MSENLMMAALDTADLMAIEGGRGRCHGHGGHEGQGGRQGGIFNNQLGQGLQAIGVQGINNGNVTINIFE
jgi:hypothetical protein